MSDIVISVESLWKQYRYGVLSHRALYKDVQSRWARFRGREDPNVPIGKSSPITRHPSPASDDADHFWALQDINFEVKQGEVLGIIGKNGAGKSTLLKIMSRVTTPTKGQIKIKGRIASLLEVGTGFHPELTGRENIFLNGAILGMSKAEIKKKFDEIVAFAEVEKFIDTPVKRYSSGMHVRLAFAVAAHLEPEILIVDEVLAVGDAGFQKKCLGKMGDVAKEGRTVLFVSHNMNAVSRLCSRGLILDSGEMTFNGNVDKAIEQYISNIEQTTQAWSASESGQHYVHLRKVSIEKTDGSPCRVFQFDEEIIVQIEYIAPIESKDYFVAVTVANAFGTFVLSSWDKDYGLRPDFVPGKLVVSKCRVPARFLKPGCYRLFVDVDTLAQGSSDRHETIWLSMEINEQGFNFEGARTRSSNAPDVWPVLIWTYEN
jgi:lipopolysaccharide transport system ATP-binding protein